MEGAGFFSPCFCDQTCSGVYSPPFSIKVKNVHFTSLYVFVSCFWWEKNGLLEYYMYILLCLLILLWMFLEPFHCLSYGKTFFIPFHLPINIPLVSMSILSLSLFLCLFLLNIFTYCCYPTSHLCL